LAQAILSEAGRSQGFGVGWQPTHLVRSAEMPWQ